MRQAVGLAAGHHPHPNPRVGAVVLDASGRIIGEGAHRGPGSPHAEVVALAAAGPAARGATMVVTLEPCTHQGRTPPCVEALLAAGIGRVVVGAVDPDRRVKGEGVRRLRAAGVEVETGVLEAESEAVDPAYFFQRRRGRPRVTLKAAITLDGQTAAADGTSRWITGEEARADAHLLRAEVDAVLVGAGTLRTDDPRLDVRLPGYSGHQPVPVVLGGSAPLPDEARLWRKGTLVLAPGRPSLPEVEVMAVPEIRPGRLEPLEVLRVLEERGFLELLVEGGAAVAASFWDAGLVDRGVWYLGGMIAGGTGLPAFEGVFATMASARRVEIVDMRRLGPDLRVEWRAEPPS